MPISLTCLALPTVILNSPAVSEYASGGDNPKFGTATDIIGIIFFAIGLFWEATGDLQKVCSNREVTLTAVPVQIQQPAQG